eukprot:4977528-Prymnesium_polylepis.2
MREPTFREASEQPLLQQCASALPVARHQVGHTCAADPRGQTFRGLFDFAGVSCCVRGGAVVGSRGVCPGGRRGLGAGSRVRSRATRGPLLTTCVMSSRWSLRTQNRICCAPRRRLNSILFTNSDLNTHTSGLFELE